MIKVVFVGDKPSVLNVSEDIPFVGAACFKRLITWIKKLQPDYYLALNSETERELRDIELLVANDFKVIALGVHAAIRLRDRGIKHFTIPHPSGRNVRNNDLVAIEARLEEACRYLKGEVA